MYLNPCFDPGRRHNHSRSARFTLHLRGTTQAFGYVRAAHERATSLAVCHPALSTQQQSSFDKSRRITPCFLRVIQHFGVVAEDVQRIQFYTIVPSGTEPGILDLFPDAGYLGVGKGNEVVKLTCVIASGFFVFINCIRVFPSRRVLKLRRGTRSPSCVPILPATCFGTEASRKRQ